MSTQAHRVDDSQMQQPLPAGVSHKPPAAVATSGGMALPDALKASELIGVNRDLCASVTACVQVVDSLRAEMDRQNDKVAGEMNRLKDTVLAGTAAFTQDAMQRLKTELRAEFATEVASFISGVGFQKLREELRADVSVEISAATACAQAGVQEMLESIRREADRVPDSLLASCEANPDIAAELRSQLIQNEEALRQEVGAQLGDIQAQFAAQLEGLRQEMCTRCDQLQAFAFDNRERECSTTTTVLSSDVEHRLGREIEAMRLEIAAQTELMLEKVSEVQLAVTPRIEADPTMPVVDMSSEHLRALSQLVTTVAAMQGEISVLRDDCSRATTVLGIHVEKHLERDAFNAFQVETRRELAIVTEAMTSLLSSLGAEEGKVGRRVVKDGGTGAEPGSEEKAILIAHIQQIEDQVEALHRRVEEVFKSYQLQSQVVKEIAAKCKTTADGAPSQTPSAAKRHGRHSEAHGGQGLQVAEVHDAFRRFQGDVETRLKVETLHRETLEARIHELQVLVKDQDRHAQPVAPRGRRSVGDATGRGRSPTDHSEGRDLPWDPMKRISRSPSKPSSHDGIGNLGHTASAPTLDANEQVATGGTVTPKFIRVERPGGSCMSAVRSMQSLSRAASQGSSLHVQPPPGQEVLPQHPQASPQSGAQSPYAMPQSPVASPQSPHAVWMHSRRPGASGFSSSPSASGRPLKGAARVQEGSVHSATRSSMSRQIAASRGGTRLITASGGHDGEPARLITTAANRLARSQASD
mmetsp:Transcript_6098/g.10518  ORF Transcript_6098/g.10518 Transcript_6098/m.10518 type:complete len:755 (-) Transcript_6098:191-2455(-)